LQREFAHVKCRGEALRCTAFAATQSRYEAVPELRQIDDGAMGAEAENGKRFA
jgi:hypothetical protein